MQCKLWVGWASRYKRFNDSSKEKIMNLGTMMDKILLSYYLF